VDRWQESILSLECVLVAVVVVALAAASVAVVAVVAVAVLVAAVADLVEVGLAVLVGWLLIWSWKKLVAMSVVAKGRRSVNVRALALGIGKAKKGKSNPMRGTGTSILSRPWSRGNGVRCAQDREENGGQK